MRREEEITDALVYGQNPAGDESALMDRLEPVTAHLIKERLIGVSRWAEDARAAVMVHAAHDQPVVLEGEPGSGKEFLARLMHKCSRRSEGPFVAISCQLASSESIDAALFGSVRASSSGGAHKLKGVVESATGGTLYINGAFGLSAYTQEKIARLIRCQEFRRVGSNLFEPVDLRIILGATHTLNSAPENVSALGGMTLSTSDRLFVPPLRERTADIGPLSEHFAKRFCLEMGKERREVAPETVSLLCLQDWRGNVGELKRVIYYMVRNSEPPCLDPSSLPAQINRPPDFKSAGIDLNAEVERFEKELICAALRQCRGVQYKAAQLLGLKPTTINMKLARYGINWASFK